MEDKTITIVLVDADGKQHISQDAPVAKVKATDLNITQAQIDALIDKARGSK